MWHADGYIEIKDRSKDIIISGGENVSSLEVEEVLYRHPARHGGRGRGEAGPEVGRDALRVRHAQAGGAADHGRGHHRVVPRAPRALQGPARVVFGPLPKTSTGKIQKYVLREQAKAVE